MIARALPPCRARALTTTHCVPSRPSASSLTAARRCCAGRRGARRLAALATQSPDSPEAEQQQQPHAWRRCSVAVIGAGAAGLAAARELLREGHAVQVFEQGGTVGGVWQYSEEVEEGDLLGQDPARAKKVHSSMYRNLRTNLPREIMGYSDFPFTPRMMGQRSVDPRRFCSHVEVLRYLQAFSDYYDLGSVIRFNTCVERVTPVSHPAPAGGGGSPGQPAGAGAGQQQQGLPLRWRVRTRAAGEGVAPATGSVTSAGGSVNPGAGSVAPCGAVTEAEFEFDAVVVCNGHYSEPRAPQVPGMDAFPGLQLHSHNYRGPEPFRGQVVLVVGASNSGEDISREVAEQAHTVYLSARSWRDEPLAQAYGARGNIYRYPLVSSLTPHGHALFPSPSPSSPSSPSTVSLPVDTVIYATGYSYTFPFLLEQPQPQPQPQPTSPPAPPPSPPPAPAAAHAPVPTVPSVGSVLGVEEQRVGPLFQHIFPPLLAPGLSFLGLPWKVVPFPQADVQAKLVARVLSGRSVLPDPQAMLEAVQASYRGLQAAGVPRRYTHMQNQEQWQYNDGLARMCGPDVGGTPGWRVQMYSETGLIKRSCPETYRDGPFSPQDQELMRQARLALDQEAERLWAQQPAWSNRTSNGSGGGDKAAAGAGAQQSSL